jgi:hypothetical protein
MAGFSHCYNKRFAGRHQTVGGSCPNYLVQNERHYGGHTSGGFSLWRSLVVPFGFLYKHLTVEQDMNDGGLWTADGGRQTER